MKDVMVVVLGLPLLALLLAVVTAAAVFLAGLGLYIALWLSPVVALVFLLAWLGR